MGGGRGKAGAEHGRGQIWACGGGGEWGKMQVLSGKVRPLDGTERATGHFSILHLVRCCRLLEPEKFHCGKTRVKARTMVRFCRVTAGLLRASTNHVSEARFSLAKAGFREEEKADEKCAMMVGWNRWRGAAAAGMPSAESCTREDGA